MAWQPEQSRPTAQDLPAKDESQARLHTRSTRKLRPCISEMRRYRTCQGVFLKDVTLANCHGPLSGSLCTQTLQTPAVSPELPDSGALSYLICLSGSEHPRPPPPSSTASPTSSLRSSTTCQPSPPKASSCVTLFPSLLPELELIAPSFWSLRAFPFNSACHMKLKSLV